MAKYKFKRLTMLSMVYDDFASQGIDTMDRHVNMVSSYFKRNMSEAVNTWKESIQEWVQWVMPSDEEDKNQNLTVH